PHSPPAVSAPFFLPWAIHSTNLSAKPRTHWSSCRGTDSSSTDFPRQSRSPGPCAEEPRSSAPSTMADSRSAPSKSTSRVNPLAFLECYYWIRKLQARFFAGDYVSAIEAVDKVETWYATSPALSLFPLEKAEYHFYAALSRAARCEPTGADPYAKYREALWKH